jgi:hypothetical protein
VAKPPGNGVEPKFVKHNNITKKFKKALINEGERDFKGRGG